MLEEYRAKFLAQERQVLGLQDQLKVLRVDNQMLLEQAARDMASLEKKQQEVEQFRRKEQQWQREGEQKARPRRQTVQPASIQKNQSWISSDLEHKLNHFAEIRQLFIEDLGNQVSSIMQATPQSSKHQAQSVFELPEEDPSNVAQDFTSSESSSEDSMVLLETPVLEESKTVLVSLDSQLRDKETLLRTFTQSQQELQNGLLEAMKQEYHLKVEQLSRELERLEADKQSEMKKVQGVLRCKVEGEFNSRQQQVQQQMQQAAKKDRDTRLMQRSLDDQQKRIQALQSDLDRLKTQKVLMMKKVKDETEKLQQARQERVKEVTRLKNSLQKAEKQNSELKREIVKKDVFAKRK